MLGYRVPADGPVTMTWCWARRRPLRGQRGHRRLGARPADGGGRGCGRPATGRGPPGAAPVTRNRERQQRALPRGVGGSPAPGSSSDVRPRGRGGAASCPSSHPAGGPLSLQPGPLPSRQKAHQAISVRHSPTCPKNRIRPRHPSFQKAVAPRATGRLPIRPAPGGLALRPHPMNAAPPLSGPVVGLSEDSGVHA